MAVDKDRKNAYLWYSGATDLTGKTLAEALEMKHGRDKPNLKDVCMVVGWGAKTGKAVDLAGVEVMNHPDKIRANRNKLNALKIMEKAGVAVAPFIDAEEYTKIGKPGCKVSFPVIGRTNWHQGGKGFWTCPAAVQAHAAAGNGAGYFQQLIEIKDEFRLHTFGDKVIYAVKKVARSIEDMEDAFIKHETQRQKDLTEKAGEKFDAKTMDNVIRRMAKKHAADGPNMLIRSNRMGWKFVPVAKVDAGLEKVAVDALKAIGLNFGAVDACTDVNGKHWILEVNTGPGLEGKSLETWAAEFKKHIDKVLKPVVLAEKIAKVAAKKAAPAKKAVSIKETNSKKSLLDKIALMKEMTEAADEQEAGVLLNVFKKMM